MKAAVDIVATIGTLGTGSLGGPIGMGVAANALWGDNTGEALLKGALYIGPNVELQSPNFSQSNTGEAVRNIQNTFKERDGTSPFQNR